MEDSRNILLHCCCAPCAGGCVERLLETYGEVAFYFSNSNLANRAEYDRRLRYVRELGSIFKVRVWVDPYDHDAWLAKCAPLADEPEGGARCRKCFEFSLCRTAAFAASAGFAKFATSLTVSPRKPSAVILAVGSGFMGFEPWDFKKKNGYLRGTQIARENNFYRQNFCGCEFSLAARENLDSSSSLSTPPACKSPESGTM
ncbi:MAG: epoxyqueuosine reductase QueH [Victivallaceae bacterium]|nr:epoxyqueuosine reductase QueH [Victivallaceae bacterium]